MATTCFVCLGKSRDKVCDICECYAHPKCWGEYLQHSTEVETYIFPNHVIVSTPLSVPCPQCRGEISNVKPITRSDTRLARCAAITTAYKNILFKMEMSDDRDERENLLSSVFDVLVNNSFLFKDDNDFRKMVQSKLKALYDEGWESANLYHRSLFGRQLLG